MNTKIYIMEKNDVISEYQLTSNTEQIDNLINDVKDMHLESYHVNEKNFSQNYIPSTIINSTNDLVNYLNSIKNSSYLDLTEINKLFKEYNNQMYSPQTMMIFKSLFDISQIEHLSDFLINEKTSAYIKSIFYQSFAEENIILKTKLAYENKKALERLGINIKMRSQNNQKVYKKTIF